MVVEVAVMYGDLRVVRVPWADKASLQRDQVLAVSVVNMAIENPKNRRQLVHSYDVYVLAWDDSFSHLGGYDDDFIWLSLTEPWKPHLEGYIYQLPYWFRENTITFEGVYVSKEQWTLAREIIDDRDGAMN